MKNSVTLEMSIAELKIVEEALRNFRERIQYLQERNEDNFDKYQDLKLKEKRLEKILEDLNK